MQLNPADYNVPPQYTHWDGDQAENHLGPFFCRFTENNHVESAMRVADHHVSGLGTIHGGFLMAFADYTLGAVATDGGTCSSVTVTCNQEFVGPAFKGNLIIGYGELIRKTATLFFVRCTLKVGDRIIMTASGVFKPLRATKTSTVSPPNSKLKLA